MTNKFKNMTNAELAAYLKDYSMERGGEIADLTREASIRITVLSEGIKAYEQFMEDDGK